MKKGQIIDGIGGIYTVMCEDNTMYKSKARGLFRKENISPIVGDYVNIDISSDNKGYIKEIFTRKNELVRPRVANIDQLILVFSMKEPDINYNLLDKFLVMAEYNNLDVIICINKIDLMDLESVEKIKDIYYKAGYKIIFTSAKEKKEIDEFKNVLKNKVNAFAGPSGVGKSSLLNVIDDKLNLITNTISNKTKRGRHTTRSVKLIELDFGGYVLDTPGFTSLELEDINEFNLKDYYKDFNKYESGCKFRTCMHISEPNCAVKQAVLDNKISEDRYNRYIEIYNQLKNKR